MSLSFTSHQDEELTDHQFMDKYAQSILEKYLLVDDEEFDDDDDNEEEEEEEDEESL